MVIFCDCIDIGMPPIADHGTVYYNLLQKCYPQDEANTKQIVFKQDQQQSRDALVLAITLTDEIPILQL